MVTRHFPSLETPFEQLVETCQQLTLSNDDCLHRVRSPPEMLEHDIVIRHHQARFVIDASRGLRVNGHLRRRWTLTKGDVLQTEHGQWVVGLE
jgi:hypothetical protein